MLEFSVSGGTLNSTQSELAHVRSEQLAPTRVAFSHLHASVRFSVCTRSHCDPRRYSRGCRRLQLTVHTRVNYARG